MNLIKYLSRFPFMSDVRKLEWHPHFFLMRIRVLELSPDWSKVRIQLPLNSLNRNPGGGMFGGSIAALADPIAALACVARYREYNIWTRELNLDFRHAAMGHLQLRFEFPEETHLQILDDLKTSGRSSPIFTYGLYSANDIMNVRVICKVAIRPANYLGDNAKKAHL